MVFRSCNGAVKDVSVPVRRSMTRASAAFLAHDVLSYHKKGSVSSDVTLVCNDVRFPVHKTILEARSDVFAAMFQHEGTKEAATKEVEISDVDAPTLKKFVK